MSIRTSQSTSRTAVETEWLDISGLTQYASVSQRTIREWIHRVTNPLPAAQVGNKLLIKRSIFDEWLTAHNIKPSHDVSVIVEDVMQRMQS